MNDMIPLKVVGLMSGTSVDGIDACLVEINPDLSFKVIESTVYDYPENIKQQIYNLITFQHSVKDVCWMNFIIGEYFAKAALSVIEKAGLTSDDVHLIGSHGQTIYHYPTVDQINDLPKTSTLQIGEPAVIAERTGITTISDFRTMDIAVGGQGAPLVCFADELIFKSDKSRAIQNIGGIGNVTVVSPECNTFAFDTGPGNTLIDYYTRKFFDQPYDKDGLIAKSGSIDEKWLNILMNESYYSIEPPKTTGRELFSSDYAEKILKDAPTFPNDVIATITALTSRTIYESYKNFIFPKTNIDEVILGGGGAYNSVIVEQLQNYLGSNIKILTHEDFGISNKFKEAIAFALLAYTCYYQIPNNVPSCTGARKKAVLGKLVFMKPVV